MLTPLPTVERAFYLLQQEESQRDILVNTPGVESTAFYSKSTSNSGNAKCEICGYKRQPPDKSWEKVGYPTWHYKYKQSKNGNLTKSKTIAGSTGVGNTTVCRTSKMLTSIESRQR